MPKYRHIVLFKLIPTLSEAEKVQHFQTFKAAIEDLPKDIPFIQEIEVGFNTNASEQWDICLNALFNNLEEIHQYSLHPLHLQAAIGLKPYVAERSCVDYETLA